MVSTEKTTEVLGKLSEGEASAADGTAACCREQRGSGQASSTTETAASPKPDTGAQAATKPRGSLEPRIIPSVAHESLSPGDICPACGRGKLYALKEPARFLRIVGQAPLVAVCWDCQRLRSLSAPHGARTRRGAGRQAQRNGSGHDGAVALRRRGATQPPRAAPTRSKKPVPFDAVVMSPTLASVEPVYRELRCRVHLHNASTCGSSSSSA